MCLQLLPNIKEVLFRDESEEFLFSGAEQNFGLLGEIHFVFHIFYASSVNFHSALFD